MSARINGFDPLLLCQNKTDGYIFCDLCAVFVSFVVKIRQNKLDKALSGSGLFLPIVRIPGFAGMTETAKSDSIFPLHAPAFSKCLILKPYPDKTAFRQKFPAENTEG